MIRPTCFGAWPTLVNPATWELEDFVRHFDVWVADVRPDALLQQVVLAWIVDRVTNPYQGVRREPDFDNLWFGTIPNTYDATDHVVTGSYFIYETEHVVVCNSIATLRTPI